MTLNKFRYKFELPETYFLRAKVQIPVTLPNLSLPMIFYSYLNDNTKIADVN